MLIVVEPAAPLPPIRALAGGALLICVRKMLALLAPAAAAALPRLVPANTNVPLVRPVAGFRTKLGTLIIVEEFAPPEVLARIVVAPAPVMVPKFCVVKPLLP